MLTFLLSNAIRGIGQRDYVHWSMDRDYRVGDIVVHARNKYIAMSNGKSGRVSPVHSSGQLTDGGVVWLFVESIPSSDSVTESVFIKLSGATDYFKKLSATMFSAGKRYKKYEETAFVAGDIVLVDYSVFVVVVGGNSTIKPASKTRYPFQTSDNIVWRYCGDIPKESRRFITDTYIPIKTDKFVTRNVQWQARIETQSGNLTNETIPHGIQVFKNPNGELYMPWVSEQTGNDTVIVGKSSGTGYELKTTVSNGAVNITVVKAGTGIAPTDKIVIVGDGTGAETTISVDSNGAITNVTVTGGQNYTRATAFIVKKDHAVIAIDRTSKAPWEVLNNGTADSLIVNTKIDTITGKIDSSFRYNKVALVSSTITTERHLTELPEHNVLFEKTIPPKQRTDNQEESITLEFKLGE